MRPKVIRILIALLVLSASQGWAEQPNRLIWVTIDTLRADHLRHLGYDRDTSPWLDEFAQQSASFRWAFAPSNVTRWSVSGFFTGRYSRDLVDTDPPLHLPRDAKTIAELLREKGFRTSAYIANGTLRRGLGYEQGFDRYDVVLPRSALHATMDEMIYAVGESYTPYDGPEFIYLHTMDAHAPWQPPIPYDTMFAPEEYTRGVVHLGRPIDVYNRSVMSSHPYHSEVHFMNEEDTRMVVSQYDGLIRYTDSRLGELLNSVQYDPGQDLVVITSDHGEAFFEHDYLEHGRHLFPEETRVPLLIRGPGVEPGLRTEAVSLLDLVPTLAEIFELELDERVVGTSLAGALKGESVAKHFAVSEHSHRTVPAAIVVGEGYLYRMSGFSHLREPWRTWPFMEGLYALAEDPLCANNLVAELPEVADRYNGLLRELNPKFRAYTRERIAGPKEVKLGPNLLPVDGRWRAAKPSVFGTRDGEFSLARTGQMLVAPINVEDPGRAHVLEVEYRVKSGVLRLKLQKEPDKNIFPLLYSEYLHHNPNTAWDYPVHVQRDEFRRVKSIVYPAHETMYFIAAMEEPGEAELRSISLKRAHVPEIPGRSPVPAWPKREAQSAPAFLNEEQRNRLEALGYFE